MKVNYDQLMMEEIESLKGEKKKLLMHSCCGPCSTACIERLKPFFDITVIYYNPNIEPMEEYLHRKEVQKELLRKLEIPFIESDYENDLFLEKTKSLAFEPEGGKRCPVCFSLRLSYTAKIAKERDFDYFTTTLTVSPHKNSQIINQIGKEVEEKIGIRYLVADFKKRDGYKRSIELASEYNLYRQNYCGCHYSRRNEYEE